MGSESSTTKLPVLHFTKDNLKPGTESWSSTCKNVRQALEEYGCFIVEYDNFQSEHRCAVYSAMEKLFDLSTETKMKNRYDEKPLNGYVGQIPMLPLHESMGIDNAISLEATQYFTNLMWPNGNNHFCENIFEYTKIVAELDQMVSRMIFHSYGLELYHDAYIGSTTYLLRLLKNRAPRNDEPNLAFVTHTDKSFTTILHQNEVSGLEVQSRDGDTIDVDFSPSSFVVIAGDALMAWSNDRILSPSHQVIMRGGGGVDRYSLGLFAFHDGIIEVPKELIDKEHPLRYKPFEHLGLLHFFSTEGKKSKCPIKAYCGI